VGWVHKLNDIPRRPILIHKSGLPFFVCLPLAQHHQSCVDSNRHEPRGKLAGATKGRQMLKGAQQRILKRIFCILLISDDRGNLLFDHR
jgi:hypothetical protein